MCQSVTEPGWKAKRMMLIICLSTIPATHQNSELEIPTRTHAPSIPLDFPLGGQQ